MIEDERTSPAPRDGRSGRGSWSRLRPVIVLVLGLGVGSIAWLGLRQLRQQVCEERSQTRYRVASYDDRLALRELSGVPEGAHHDQRDWTDIRPRLDAHEREWIALRTRACVEGQTALARCLDAQARSLAARINKWVHGNRSWATGDLDDDIPAPTRCLEQLGG